MRAAPIRRCIVLLASAFAWGAADAQIVYGAGVGYGVPLYGAPWAGWPYPGAAAWHPDYYRAPGIAPSCLRIGRCTVAEMEYYYRQPQTLERRAPAPPEGIDRSMPPAHLFGPGVGPTPDEAVRPEYRGVSRPREEFSESGKPIER